MDDSNKGKGLIYANTKIKASLYPFYALVFARLVSFHLSKTKARSSFSLLVCIPCFYYPLKYQEDKGH